MKKIMILAAAGMLLTSCIKNNNGTPTNTSADTTPPVITMNGKTNDTMSLNSTYTDPGTSALDNVDGNVSANVTVSGTINKDLVGEYRLYYNVKDAAGNSAVQMTRYVYVANDADYLEGTYMATPNCGASTAFSSTVTVQASTTINNRVSFGSPGNVSTFLPYYNVSGNTVTAPLQTSGQASFVGNGTLGTAPNGKTSIAVSFTANSGTNSYGTWNCSSNFVKQ